MKKIFTLAAVACMALAANAQNGAPLYATGAGGFATGEWNPGNPTTFEYNGSDYVLKVDGLTQFKISTTSGAAEGDWNGFNAGAYDCGEGYGDVPGVARPLYANSDAANIACPWKGDYTITVAGDLSTITLTTSTPAPDPNTITPVFLRGDMNGWGSPEEWQMEGIIDGVYRFTCNDSQYIGVGETFKIADADWNTINYGTSGGNVTLDADYQVYYNADNMQLEEEWYGIVWVDVRVMDDAWVIFSNDKNFIPEWAEEILSGVEGVTVEKNSTPVYYNLQGVKVANPENGLFIVVKDGKATKVVK